MLKKVLLISFALLLLSGCGGNSKSAQETGQESSGRLFGGKCAANQEWLSRLESAITVPADWQAVYDLVDHTPLEDFWGISSEGSTITGQEGIEWNVYTSRLGAAVVQGNYSEAIRMYDLLYPLMEKMDLGCAVSVTGKAALITTIVP